MELIQNNSLNRQRFDQNHNSHINSHETHVTQLFAVKGLIICKKQ